MDLHSNFGTLLYTDPRFKYLYGIGPCRKFFNNVYILERCENKLHEKSLLIQIFQSAGLNPSNIKAREKFYFLYNTDRFTLKKKFPAKKKDFLQSFWYC
jgi:hypothetical protein